MVHDLNLKNLHINGLFFVFLFFTKSKKPYLWGVFGNYPQNEICSQKSGYVRFLPLRHPNFMRRFRKILWAVSEKTRLPNDILTYWQTEWWNHRTPFRLKAGFSMKLIILAVFRVSSLLILYFIKVIFQDIRENIVKRCILYFVVLGSSLSTREPSSIKNCAWCFTLLA